MAALDPPPTRPEHSRGDNRTDHAFLTGGAFERQNSTDSQDSAEEPPASGLSQWIAILIYICHSLLELVLGAIKLRGTYSELTTPPEAAKFVRHHGIALLSLSLLGFLVLYRRLVHTATGELASWVLAFFHASAVAVMVHALNAKVVILHLPFAVAFAWHALRPKNREHED
uniref:Uncharacterized protein n=1 Tax=Haptolina ericina TaxID=156174 RepID=A0A7S3AF75_9EUKA